MKTVLGLYSLLLPCKSPFKKKKSEIVISHFSPAPSLQVTGVTCPTVLLRMAFVGLSGSTNRLFLAARNNCCLSFLHTFYNSQMFITQCSSLVGYLTLAFAFMEVMRSPFAKDRKIVLELNFFPICSSPSCSLWWFYDVAQVSKSFL